MLTIKFLILSLFSIFLMGSFPFEVSCCPLCLISHLGPFLHDRLALFVFIFEACYKLEICMFWDCLAFVFMLYDQIMHALYSCKSFHVPSFEFPGSFHASGAMFPCFGAVL